MNETTDETTDETTEQPAQYLTWDYESEVWSIQTVEGIAKDYEHSYYSGHGRPDVIMVLPADGTPPVPVTATFEGEETGDNDYFYMAYLLRGAQANYEQFIVKIDGRA
jgi:hypothetical protein